MRLLELPVRIEIFFTRFGDFLFNFDTTNVVIDRLYYFRYNVSSRLETQEVVLHFYEQFHQIYIELSLFDIRDFVEDLDEFDYDGDDFDIYF